MARMGVLLLALLLAAAPRASAGEPSPQAMRAAKQHYLDGKKFQDAKNWDAAVVEYEAAYKLAPKPQLQFNIGQCQRLKGDKEKAIAAYEAFVAAAPDDPAADEAREHINTLKLQLETERAEAASKRAQEEAEVARRQAAELEAARKRVEAEEAARQKRALEDEARHRKELAAAAEADRRRRADEEAEKAKRLRDARNVGHTLRLAGGLTVVGGLVLFGLSFTTVIDANNQMDTIKNQPNQTWGPSGDRAVQQLRTDSSVIIALWAISGLAIVGGSAVAIAGAVQRSRAVERVEAHLVPVVTPTGGALAVVGRF